MRAKILSKNHHFDDEDEEKFFHIIDDIVEIVIGKSKIMLRREDRTLYRANCNNEQSFNIQLSAEKGELIDLTELDVEVFGNAVDWWETYLRRFYNE